MDFSNPEAEHHHVESAIRKLGISREEAAELQGYIKRLLDEDKAVRKGYPVESLLIHRYQNDWKYLRIWKDEPVINVELAFMRCVEAVRNGLNLSKFPISNCLPASPSSTTVSFYPAKRQTGLVYSSGSESTSTRKSRGSSTSHDHGFDSVSSRTTAPTCSPENCRRGFNARGFRGSPPPGSSDIRSHSRSRSSPLRSPSFNGGWSDPGLCPRSRKYPPIVERQYSLPLAPPRPGSSSSSRASSPILPSDLALPPCSPTTLYQPNKASQKFSPPHNYTFTEKTTTSSYRTWYPEPRPISHKTPSLVLPTSPYSNGLIPKMDTTTTTPSRKPAARTRAPSSSDIIPAPLNLPPTRTRRMSYPAASYHHQNPHHTPDGYQPTLNPPPTPPARRSSTLPGLPITKTRHTSSPPRDDVADKLCLGKKRDMTPDFEIVPVTRLSPQSQSRSSRTREQGHRRERAKSRSRGDKHGQRNKQSDREEEREGGSWRKLVCGCCGDEH
ncbi:hypothetical protein QBC41DRAFT_360609 [Cercophora samala]|uniref:Uncharacterized protein n=1 Tax=Cercophora samala TaxID=330535 RepID=A0AA40D0C1_9PEZI|nr:hypothetical protein QBC41DRAFT_360609 [Cercophora samala]